MEIVLEGLKLIDDFVLCEVDLVGVVGVFFLLFSLVDVIVGEIGWWEFGGCIFLIFKVGFIVGFLVSCGLEEEVDWLGERYVGGCFFLLRGFLFWVIFGFMVIGGKIRFRFFFWFLGYVFVDLDLLNERYL